MPEQIPVSIEIKSKLNFQQSFYISKTRINKNKILTNIDEKDYIYNRIHYE